MHACMCVFCFSVRSGSFEQGSFCETFHSEVAGWRNCEACGKVCILRLHAASLCGRDHCFLIADWSVPVFWVRAGQRLHCGCIVSVHAYALLDAGGVDCILCARKAFAAMVCCQRFCSCVRMDRFFDYAISLGLFNWVNFIQFECVTMQRFCRNVVLLLCSIYFYLHSSYV
jgi:hypothetical protein